MKTVSEFKKQLDLQVNNHSIYIWAGSGTLAKNVNEAWIRAKEARVNNGKYTADAIKEWRNVMKTKYADVARCFDCSGYVSWCLIEIGALDKRRDCDGLWSKCTPLSKPENGALLFRVNASNPNDETHVGVYFDGYQYHAKGRKDGVTKEKYKASFWAKCGWYKALDRDKPSTFVFTRVLKYGSTGDDVVELKRLLIAKGYGKGITTDTKSSPNYRSTTRKRVKEFQKAVGLKVDGIAGKDTIIALGGTYK